MKPGHSSATKAKRSAALPPAPAKKRAAAASDSAVAGQPNPAEASSTARPGSGQPELGLENTDLQHTRTDPVLSSRKYFAHFELAPVGLMRLSPRGLILEANALGARMLGLEAHYLNSFKSSLPNYLHPQSDEVFRLHLDSVMQTGQMETCELVLRTKAGRQTHVRIQSILYTGEADPNESGEQEIYSTLTDISDLMAAEAALRKSESEMRKLALVASRTNNLVLIADPQGRVEWVNDAFIHLTEQTAGQVRNRPIESLFDNPAADRATLEQIRAAVQARTDFHLETVQSTKSGRLYWLELDGQPVLDRHGHLTHFIVIAFDVTERKHLEEQLRQDEEQLRQILQQAPMGICVQDMQGNFVRVNEALCKLLDYAPYELLRMRHTDLVHPQDRAKAESLFDELVTGQRDQYQQEIRFLRRGAEGINIHARCGLVRDRAGRPLYAISVVEDASWWRRQEEERIKASKLEAMGLLAGGIAHDMNNIMMGIQLNLDMILKEIQLERGSQEVVLEAKNAAARASDLSRRLLTFAKGGDPIKRIVNLTDTIRSTVEFSLRGSTLEPRFDIAPDLSHVCVDPGQIAQVLDNLAINARQATPLGGVLTVRAHNVHVTEEEIQELAAGSYIKIDVADYGVGIPEAIIHKIFDPYFTTKQTGSGIGLATCYSMVRRHQGVILVESQVGSGSTFSLYLPVSEQAPTSRALPAAPRTEVARASLGRILLIDDQPMLLKVLSRMLETLGYEVEMAPDGLAGAEMVQSGRHRGDPFDVILLDGTIPGGLGGEEALRAIRGVDQVVRIILCSGYSNSKLMMNWQRAGFQGILPKPFTCGELAELLEQVLGKK